MPIPLLTPVEMADWDRLTIEEFGIPGSMLMENASREIFHVLNSHFSSLEGSNIVLFAGSGNNGGDAFALARHLREHKAKCLVLHTRELQEYTGDTAFHLQLAQKSDVRMMKLIGYNLESLNRPDILIDGLLGTGFHGPLRQDYQHWIEVMNRLGRNRFVLSIDIPSGLNGLTGLPEPIAVKADCTVTFEEAKRGLFMPEACEHVGHLEIRKIGIPETIKTAHPPSAFGLTREVLQTLPVLECSGHKGQAGRLLILGGSPGLTGAATLAGLGALRSGSGLVTVAAPEDLCPEIKQGRPDLMTRPLASGRHWTRQMLDPLQEAIQESDALIIGPGMGRDPRTIEFIQALVQSQTKPTVYDADALFALAAEPELLDRLSPQSILTPHPGEMARLCGCSPAEIQSSRSEHIQNIVQKSGCTVILKGAGTVVGASKRPLFFSPFACGNLAVGGSGDVLSGILGSLLARSMEPFAAANAAVYWHGLAGNELRKQFPHRGNLAQEIAHTLPLCLDFFNNHA